MNDKITISTFQLFTMLPDEGTARKYLEGRLWKDGCKCPKCSSGKRITPRRDGYYRCNACKLDFTIGHYWPQFRKRLAQFTLLRHRDETQQATAPATHSQHHQTAHS